MLYYDSFAKLFRPLKASFGDLAGDDKTRVLTGLSRMIRFLMDARPTSIFPV